MQRIPMTIMGAQRLREELERLKKVDRTQVINAISEARALGDLKENAEYHAAKERQGFVEGRIQEIEAKLSRAQIIDVKQIPNHGKVIFGSTVTLRNIETNENITYQIVGEDEADLKHNKISVHSPIARAIIGKHQGDHISVTIPNGVTEYEILTVEYL